MSDFVIKRRRSRYTGPVDPCLGYYAGSDHKHEEQFVPSSVPSEIELELELNSSEYPNANMDLAEDQKSQQEEETSSIIDADWSVLASYKSSTTRQHRGHFGRASHDPEPLTSDYLTVDGFLRQTAKINPKNIVKYGERNKVSSDGRKGRRRRYCTLRRVQDSSDSPSSRVKIIHLGKHEPDRPRSNGQSDDAPADGSSSDFHRYSPSIGFASPPLPSPAPNSYHAKSTNRHRKRMWKKRKPLRVRLYEAAVSTHVDPEAAFAQAPDDPETHHRLPLRLFPEPSTHTDNVGATPPRKKMLNWALIDPRKSRAIEDAQFSAILRPRIETGLKVWSAALSNTLDRLPIDSWRWDTKSKVHARADSPAAKKRNNATASVHTTGPEPPPRPTCVPLTFVPLDEGELLGRKDIRNRRLKAQRQPKKRAASPSGLRMVPIEALEPKIRRPPDEQQALNLQPVQLSLAGKATDSAENAPTLSELQQNIDLLVPGNNSPLNPSSRCSYGCDESEPRSITSATTQPNAVSTKRKAPPVSQSIGLLRSSKKRKTFSGPEADAMSTPRSIPTTSRPNTKTESKPLKPLVTYMDQFLENLRNVSMNIDSGAPQSSNKLAGRPSSRRRQDSVRVRISGATTSIGSSTAVFRPDNDSGDTNKDQVQYSLFTEKTSENLDPEPSGSCTNLEIAGPDLSTLFERELDYHVLLSSPSC
ncbi:hypothetical protein D9619_004891 [Psilocybe cf. subviscida]|uniref:Rrn9 domain-containing protein n=1 Tax=Psilocybe cf. subviscida TaxID=2480587 RepID=A0A8H5BQ42_9AGAR|nr:hypothetical protein D9619_004891 [Psilocybe cf. subviscida]